MFSAPISYRAVTGDSPSGENGAFAPGRTISLSEVEAADGLSFTAGFSERLVGDNQPSHASLNNYQVVNGRLSRPGCPVNADPASWRGDAGSSWRASDYRSTLYNHALPPNGQPSCLASDGKSAFMGASSGHARGVNLLLPRRIRDPGAAFNRSHSVAASSPRSVRQKRSKPRSELP